MEVTQTHKADLFERFLEKSLKLFTLMFIKYFGNVLNEENIHIRKKYIQNKKKRKKKKYVYT